MANKNSLVKTQQILEKTNYNVSANSSTYKNNLLKVKSDYKN